VRGKVGTSEHTMPDMNNARNKAFLPCFHAGNTVVQPPLGMQAEGEQQVYFLCIWVLRGHRGGLATGDISSTRTPYPQSRPQDADGQHVLFPLNKENRLFFAGLLHLLAVPAIIGIVRR